MSAPPPTRRSSDLHRTIFTGDNLYIMRGLDSKMVDLIYLDPPFNSKRDYKAPIGSRAAGAAFKDTWKLNDIDEAWIGEIAEENEGLYTYLKAAGIVMGKPALSYLIYMAVRLMEMHRLLKDAGSLYLHCDPTMSHYLKGVLDAIFGSTAFKSELSWRRSSGHNAAKRYGPNHDVVLFYTKSDHHTWNRVITEKYDDAEAAAKFPKVDSDGRRYATADLTGSGTRDGESGGIWLGIDPASIGKGRHWAAPNKRSMPEWVAVPYKWDAMTVIEKLDYLMDNGLVHVSRGGVPSYKKYYREGVGPVAQDFIDNIPPPLPNEDLGYPTQKPLALLELIIGSSSNPGDMVLDPFCGCATACSAAEKLDRRWIGIDISEKAYELVNIRLGSEAGLDAFTKGAGLVRHRSDIPRRNVHRSKGMKHRLYGKQEGECTGCGRYYSFKDMEMDHIVPKTKGGQDDDSNLQLLCGHCNRVKGGRLTMPELRTRLVEIGVIKVRARDDAE